MRIVILGSGSQGNATLITAGGVSVLVDAGLPPKEIRRRAELATGAPLGPIDAVVLTHAHGDHVSHARACIDDFDAKVYMSEATRRRPGLATLPGAREFGARAPFSIGGLDVRPLSVPHDAPQVALVFAADDESAAIVTDLGWVHRELIDHLRGVGTLLIEANHDERLLAAGPYPQKLQQRIRSGAGHLSNAQTAGALEALRANLNEVVLMHLSQPNNEPHLALEAAQRGLDRSKATLRAASQNEPMVLEVGVPRGQLSLSALLPP